MTMLFDGVAFGMLLFLTSVGLSVTLGLMNFINLAHGAFAMLGGYVCVSLLNRAGVPFLATLPLAMLASAAAGVVLERTLYRRLYAASHLEQVLFSIALVFIGMGAAQYVFGAGQQPVALPDWLSGQWQVAGAEIGVYRLFLVALGLLVFATLHLTVVRTRFGAQLRAAVDNPRVAAGMGIHVDRLFALTFALGTGLAGLGGALGIDMLGLDPGFAVKYIVYFLIVIAVGGSGSITGTLVAALLIGIVDVGGKYYLPQAGAFLIYTVMVAMLVVRPQGMFGQK